MEDGTNSEFHPVVPLWKVKKTTIEIDDRSLLEEGRIVAETVEKTYELLHYKSGPPDRIIVTNNRLVGASYLGGLIEIEVESPGIYGINAFGRNIDVKREARKPGFILIRPNRLKKEFKIWLEQRVPLKVQIQFVTAHELAEHISWMRGKKLVDVMSSTHLLGPKHAQYSTEQLANSTARAVVRQLTGWTLYHPDETPPEPGKFAYPPGK